MILSLDQSTGIKGYCIMNLEQELITYGIIDLRKCPKKTNIEQTKKRSVLVNQIKELVNEHNILQTITEGIYMHKNIDTYRKLAQCQSSIQDYCLRENIVCFSFANAGEWRKFIGVETHKKMKTAKWFKRNQKN